MLHRMGWTLGITCVAILTAQARLVPNFAEANLVLGQPDFTTANVPGTPATSSLDHPASVVVDPATGKIFVADFGNNRVLRFGSAAALQNGAAAELVFGQADFASNAAPTPSASSLNAPTGVWIDAGNHLWVADSGNNRVLMYQNAATAIANGPGATLILGQPDAVSGGPATSQTGMSDPQGIWVDAGGHLWVADSGNNRILRFDHAASKPAAANADGVLGHSTFTDGSSGHDQLTLDAPSAVSMDSTGTLWVADRGNNRVLGYPSAATVSNGTNAAHIVGQPDFTTVAPGLAGNRLVGPSGVFADSAGGLWVVDEGNNRVVRFAKISSLNIDDPASTVIGQPSFTTNGAALDARGLSNPFLGVFVEPDGTLWLGDRDNHRVLRYVSVDVDPPSVQIKGKPKVKTSKSHLLVRGTASDDTFVARVVLYVGRKQILASGTTTWKKSIRLKSGRTVVKAVAVDGAGHTSAPAKVVIIRE